MVDLTIFISFVTIAVVCGTVCIIKILRGGDNDKDS